MHEAGLLKDLVARIRDVAATEGVERVARVSVWLGALSHMSPEHFRDHYNIEARGSPGEGAELDIELSEDPMHPNAQGILLKSVEISV